MKPLTERKHEPQAKYGAERNTRSALNYFPPHGALAPFCALALPAAGLCVGLGRRAPAPRFPCRPPAPPCAPFSPLRLVASLLRRAGRFFLTAGGLVGPVGRVARVARSLSLALLRVGRENFSRPCPRASCRGCVCGLCPPPRFARPPRFRLPARARRLSALPPCPIIRARGAAQGLHERAFARPLRLSAPRVSGTYGGGGGGVRRVFSYFT